LAGWGPKAVALMLDHSHNIQCGPGVDIHGRRGTCSFGNGHVAAKDGWDFMEVLKKGAHSQSLPGS
jgi:hypothetical protein